MAPAFERNTGEEYTLAVVVTASVLDRNSVDGEVQGGILRRRCYLSGTRSTGAQLVPEYGHKSAVA